MANVILEVTVPEVWVTRVLNAFNAITDIDLILEARNLNENWGFSIEDKLPMENNKQFGERVLRELGKAVVNLVDKAEDRIRYKNEIATIPPPVSDVPSDILT